MVDFCHCVSIVCVIIAHLMVLGAALLDPGEPVSAAGAIRSVTTTPAPGLQVQGWRRCTSRRGWRRCR